jgi:nucleotidyltransferase substrate binding protein (TIGR01987 family)
LEGCLRLDLSPFEKSVAFFAESLQLYGDWKDPLTKLTARDSVIQRFEYTYVMSIKILQRYCFTVLTYGEVDVEDMSFADLIRTAHQKNLLLSDIDQWLAYRKARNITSHTYDSTKADEVVEVATKFLPEVQHLLNSLKKKAC